MLAVPDRKITNIRDYIVAPPPEQTTTTPMSDIDKSKLAALKALVETALTQAEQSVSKFQEDLLSLNDVQLSTLLTFLYHLIRVLQWVESNVFLLLNNCWSLWFRQKRDLVLFLEMKREVTSQRQSLWNIISLACMANTTPQSGFKLQVNIKKLQQTFEVVWDAFLIGRARFP